jgi:hypothetical protein
VSLEQLETAILELTLQERQRLAVWFEENRRATKASRLQQTGDVTVTFALPKELVELVAVGSIIVSCHASRTVRPTQANQ